MTNQFDIWQEEQDEIGGELGDPRRCPRHPDQKTSSPDGMFDTVCCKCEHENDTGQSWEEYERWLQEVHLPAMHARNGQVIGQPPPSDDDILF
jgi:hypothetical protein